MTARWVGQASACARLQPRFGGLGNRHGGGVEAPRKLFSAPIAPQELTDARSGAKAPRKLKLAPPGQVHVPTARAPGLPLRLAPPGSA